MYVSCDGIDPCRHHDLGDRHGTVLFDQRDVDADRYIEYSDYHGQPGRCGEYLTVIGQQAVHPRFPGIFRRNSHECGKWL
jgi:hypothetical protein